MPACKHIAAKRKVSVTTNCHEYKLLIEVTLLTELLNLKNTEFSDERAIFITMTL